MPIRSFDKYEKHHYINRAVKERIYSEQYNLVSIDGAPHVSILVSEWSHHADIGLYEREDFCIKGLETEIKNLPKYLRQVFGTNFDAENSPDIKLLRKAYNHLKEKIENTGATPLDCLLLDRVTEAQIAQEEHPLRNTLLDFLSGTISTSAHPHRQPE